MADRGIKTPFGHIVPADKGWLAVPGVRPKADRTLAEQMLGLERALAECRGKSVLDLGCAEGLIGLEFAKAGAARVVGIEQLAGHLAVAWHVSRAWHHVISFQQAHLAEWVEAHPQPEQFDIVLALGIIHKLDDPAVPLRFAARSAASLLCFRAPAKATGGVVRSKFTASTVSVPKEMTRLGFVDEGTFSGVRGEAVQYWRRKP